MPILVGGESQTEAVPEHPWNEAGRCFDRRFCYRRPLFVLGMTYAHGQLLLGQWRPAHAWRALPIDHKPLHMHAVRICTLQHTVRGRQSFRPKAVLAAYSPISL